MPPGEEDRADGYTPEPARRDEVLGRVLEEYDVFRWLEDQEKRRRELLLALAKADQEAAPKGTRVGVLAFCCAETLGGSIDSDDIPALCDVLLHIGDVDRLNLIISGPGGDGTIAEKIVEICRSYCKEFRVYVPNRAKSAATIVALGADELVMGFCSEIGPIDAQIPIIIDGIPRYISAQSFIDARRVLETRFKEAVQKKEDPRAILQQIATMNPAFVDHCEKVMAFGRDVAAKFLAKHMFADVKTTKEREEKIDKVIKALATVEDFKVHGRVINGDTAKRELGLNVRLMGRSDEVWKALWNYYIRVDTALKSGGMMKIVETLDFTLRKPAPKGFLQ